MTYHKATMAQAIEQAIHHAHQNAASVEPLFQALAGLLAEKGVSVWDVTRAIDRAEEEYFAS